MKKIYFVFAFSIISNFIFSQLTFPTASAAINHMSGHWVWVRSCGGIAGTCNYPSTVGYTRDLVLSPVSSANDSIQYQLFQNNILQKSLTVQVSTVATMYPGNWTLQDVTVIGTASLDLSLTLAKTDTIWLSENCSDCFQQQYARNLTVGIEKINSEKQTSILFPNPTVSMLNLNLKKEEILTIDIFDVAGNLIFTSSKSNTIDFSNHAQGIYFVQVKTPFRTFTEKLVKLNQ